MGTGAHTHTHDRAECVLLCNERVEWMLYTLYKMIFRIRIEYLHELWRFEYIL